MAIREARKDWMRETELLLSNFQPDNSLRSSVTDLQYQVKELQTQLTKPIDPSIGMPRGGGGGGGGGRGGEGRGEGGGGGGRGGGGGGRGGERGGGEGEESEGERGGAVEEIAKIRIEFWDNKANPPPVEYHRRGEPKDVHP